MMSRWSRNAAACISFQQHDSISAVPMKLAQRMQNLGTESAFDVLVKARRLEAEGRSVIHMEIGEPDFPTPPHIVEAAKKALDEGWTHYGPTQGYPELREAVAEYVARTRGIPARPQQ